MPIMPAPVEKPRPADKLDNDFHPATITLASPVMEGGMFARNDSGKTMVDFRFQLDEETDDEGNPVVLYRSKMAVTYGQYAGKWADWAQLIEAALGIPGGDKAQRNINTDDLLNKKVRVQTAKVASTKGDGKIYTNCVGYAAPKKPKVAAPAVAPPQAGPKTVAARLGLDEDALDDLPEDERMPF